MKGTKGLAAALVIALIHAGPTRALDRAEQIWGGFHYTYCIDLDSNEDIWVSGLCGASTPCTGRVAKVNEDTRSWQEIQVCPTPYPAGCSGGVDLGIRVDSGGNVWLASGSCLCRRSADGTVKEVVIDSSAGLSQLWPVRIDPQDDTAYVADSQTAKLFKVTTQAGGTHQVTAMFEEPEAVAPGFLDLAIGSNAVFVSESNVWPQSQKVWRIPKNAVCTPSNQSGCGEITTIHPEIVSIGGLEVDSHGDLWVAGQTVKKLHDTSSPGSLPFSTFASTSLTPLGFLGTDNTWMNQEDELYVATDHDEVWEIVEGEPAQRLLSYGGDSDPNGSCEPNFSYAHGIIGNSKGEIYSSTEGSNRPGSEALDDDGDLWRICPDTDSDGHCDAHDNCVQVANNHQPANDQPDYDHDGYGNACDSDFNQDGLTGTADFAVLRECFGQSVPGSGPPADPDCGESDMNSDGVVNQADADIFSARFGRPPGPSGLDCVTSPPTNNSCPVPVAGQPTDNTCSGA